MRRQHRGGVGPRPPASLTHGFETPKSWGHLPEPEPSPACKQGTPGALTPAFLPSFLCSRKPEELKDLAPGTNPPFLLFNRELKTDFIKIEEFLEQTLCPPT